MISIEMSLVLVEVAPLTGVDNRLAESFRVARFPISTIVVVCKVCNQEPSSLDFDPQLVIDQTRFGIIINTSQDEPSLLHGLPDVGQNFIDIRFVKRQQMGRASWRERVWQYV